MMIDSSELQKHGIAMSYSNDEFDALGLKSIKSNSLMETIPYVIQTKPQLILSSKMKPSKLPRHGELSTTQTLLNPDGTIKQERTYGPDGDAAKDVNYNHAESKHKFPHGHVWENGKRGPGIPLSEDGNKKNTTQEIGKWLAGGSILYWVISEGSRLFPPRNLIPIP